MLMQQYIVFAFDFLISFAIFVLLKFSLHRKYQSNHGNLLKKLSEQTSIKQLYKSLIFRYTFIEWFVVRKSIYKLNQVISVSVTLIITSISINSYYWNWSIGTIFAPIFILCDSAIYNAQINQENENSQNSWKLIFYGSISVISIICFSYVTFINWYISIDFIILGKSLLITEIIEQLIARPLILLVFCAIGSKFQPIVNLKNIYEHFETEYIPKNQKPLTQTAQTLKTQNQNRISPSKMTKILQIYPQYQYIQPRSVIQSSAPQILSASSNLFAQDYSLKVLPFQTYQNVLSNNKKSVSSISQQISIISYPINNETNKRSLIQKTVESNIFNNIAIDNLDISSQNQIQLMNPNIDSHLDKNIYFVEYQKSLIQESYNELHSVKYVENLQNFQKIAQRMQFNENLSYIKSQNQLNYNALKQNSRFVIEPDQNNQLQQHQVKKKFNDKEQSIINQLPQSVSNNKNDIRQENLTVKDNTHSRQESNQTRYSIPLQESLVLKLRQQNISKNQEIQEHLNSTIKEENFSQFDKSNQNEVVIDQDIIEEKIKTYESEIQQVKIEQIHKEEKQILQEIKKSINNNIYFYSQYDQSCSVKTYTQSNDIDIQQKFKQDSSNDNVEDKQVLDNQNIFKQIQNRIISQIQFEHNHQQQSYLEKQIPVVQNENFMNGQHPLPIKIVRYLNKQLQEIDTNNLDQRQRKNQQKITYKNEQKLTMHESKKKTNQKRDMNSLKLLSKGSPYLEYLPTMLSKQIQGNKNLLKLISKKDLITKSNSHIQQKIQERINKKL